MDEYMSDEAARSDPSTARKVTDSLIGREMRQQSGDCTTRQPCAEGLEDFTPRPSIVPGATEWRPDWSRDDLLRRDRIVSEHSAQIRRGLGRHRTEGVFRLGDLFRRWTGKRVDNRERNRLTGKIADRIIIDDPWSDDVSPEARAAARRLFLGEPADRVEATMTFTPVEDGQDFKPEGTFMVGGLVDRDLVERYESLRESFETVSADRDDWRRRAEDAIQNDTVIAELRELIRDACPAIELASQLATMTETECDFLDGHGLREAFRMALGNEAFVFPRLYSDEDRKRAISALVDAYYRGDEVERVTVKPGELVDKIAEALGMRRAGA